MEINELFRQTAKAIAEGDGERSAQLDAQIPDEDRGSWIIYLTALMAGALQHHFGADTVPTREQIADFVDRLRYEFRKADPGIKPVAIESTIRGFYGEDHLLDEVSPQDQFEAAFPVIRSIVGGSEEMRINLHVYLMDAETLAREWVEDAHSQ